MMSTPFACDIITTFGDNAEKREYPERLSSSSAGFVQFSTVNRLTHEQFAVVRRELPIAERELRQILPQGCIRKSVRQEQAPTNFVELIRLAEL